MDPISHTYEARERSVVDSRWNGGAFYLFYFPSLHLQDSYLLVSERPQRRNDFWAGGAMMGEGSSSQLHAPLTRFPSGRAVAASRHHSHQPAQSDCCAPSWRPGLPGPCKRLFSQFEFVAREPPPTSGVSVLPFAASKRAPESGPDSTWFNRLPCASAALLYRIRLAYSSNSTTLTTTT